jgi:Fe-S cluster biogenesis protein NfuA
MFIQTEQTPNPNALIFLPGKEIMGSKPPKSYHQDQDVSESPLAEILFNIEGIQDVFFGKDFITISKKASVEWAILKSPILHSLNDYLQGDNPVIIENENQSDSSNDNDDSEEVVDKIKQLIETRVRPAVAQDGGDIIFHSFENGTVYLEMFGACSGCPSSTMTLKNGIESMLKHYIPEVNRVESI